MRAALYVSCFAILAMAACKKSSATDLSTPETTLASFFSAVNESRIPDEAEVFLVEEAERASWKMRCETRGCKKVEYKILSVKEEGERGATLIVDYRVFGTAGQSVMHGEASEIRFERHNSKWGIVQFGARTGAPPPAPKGDEPAAKPASPDAQTP